VYIVQPMSSTPGLVYGQHCYAGQATCLAFIVCSLLRWNVDVHLESKKTRPLDMSITSPNVDGYSKIFAVGLNKFAINSSYFTTR